MKRLLAIAALLAAPVAPHAQSGADVRIYRCTDAKGTQTLRDTPCPKGQQQQVRDMLRPKDAPATPTRTVPPPTPAPTPAPETRTVYLAPPRPMYECVTYEGKRYSSDNDSGNPRWVPLWTLGYPATRQHTALGNNVGGLPPNPNQPTRPPLRDIIWPVATGGGQWIRDNCTMLPPQETCARLRDRRDEIRTRFFNAMPSERDVLRAEERGVNARLDNDCGGH